MNGKKIIVERLIVINLWALFMDQKQEENCNKNREKTKLCESLADQIIGRGLLSDMSQDKWGQLGWLCDGNEMEFKAK